MKANTKIGDDGIIQGALTDDDLNQVTNLIEHIEVEYFDCGHGIHNEKKKEFVRSVIGTLNHLTKYLYDRFRDLGIPVKVTRLTDETISPNDRVKRVLDAYGNSKNVIVISNHINAGGGDGAEVIYPLRNNSVLPNLILSEISKEGQNIRDAYQRRLPSDTSKDYYFMQRNTGDTQALTVEYGFLDSTKDDPNQLKNNYKNLAEAVLRFIVLEVPSPLLIVIIFLYQIIQQNYYIIDLNKLQ